jgi:hypothetical protein
MMPLSSTGLQRKMIAINIVKDEAEAESIVE